MYKFLFYKKFIIRLYMFRALCAHHREVKIVLHSIWYRHTETSEWSKITKIQLYSSTCFEHYVLIIRRSKLHYTASGIVTLKQVSGLKLLKYNSINMST